MITSEEDSVFSAPVSLGSKVGADELALLKVLEKSLNTRNSAPLKNMDSFSYSGGAILADRSAKVLLETKILEFEKKVTHGQLARYMFTGGTLGVTVGLLGTMTSGAITFAVDVAAAEGPCAVLLSAGIGFLAVLMTAPEWVLAGIAAGVIAMGVSGSVVYYYVND